MRALFCYLLSFTGGMVFALILGLCSSVEMKAAWHAGRIYGRYLRLVHKGRKWNTVSKKPAKEPLSLKRDREARTVIELWRFPEPGPNQRK